MSVITLPKGVVSKRSVRRLLYWASIAALLGLALLLGTAPIIGKPVPEFSLPPVMGRTLGLSSQDLEGEVSLVNVFASWCTACREEHPILLRLKEQGEVSIHGLNYMDRPQDAAKWLDTLGDPYTRTGADRDGRVASKWGIYGVPETFVVDREGRIAYQHIGPITQEHLDRKIRPLIVRLRR